MIPQSFIQDLLARVDIVDVIDRHVPLKRAGANYAACCPFHTEKSPSFTVSPSKQFYHCFGCGAHGSAIGFLMEYRGLGYVEAIKELAGSLGLEVPEDRHAATPAVPEAPDLHEALMQATRWYREQLKNSAEAIAYLKGRGVSGDVAARFGLGYAPAGWQGLAAAFPDYGSKLLVDAGLVVAGEDGKRYDRFRHRIMFPIVDARGKVVGFGGRVLDKSEPKYLNSPETPVFEKGRELYGLYQARQAIRAVGRVVVVEGYMDVVALAQHGVGYAVATLGTATTPVHVQKLLRQSDEVVFCFDGDAAGRRAAWRALENSLGHVADGKRVSFLFLPEGEDPDTYVRAQGPAGFEALLGQAIPLSAFMLRELAGRVDLKTEEGRARLLGEAKPLVAQIAAPALSLMVRKRLAELAGVTQAELDALLQLKPVAAAPVARASRPRETPSVARSAIEMLLLEPALAARVSAADLAPALGIATVHVPRSELAALVALLEALGQAPGVSPGALLERFRGGPHEAVVFRANPARREEGGLDAAELQREFDDAWTRLRDLVRRERIEELHRKHGREGWSPEDAAEYLALQQPASATKE